MKNTKKIVLVIVFIILFLMESFAISMKSLRAYLSMGFFDGYNTILTDVNGKLEPYIMPYYDNNHDLKFKDMTRKQRKDLMTEVVRAYSGIISCLNKLPNRYKNSFEKNKKIYKFRFIFKTLIGSHANPIEKKWHEYEKKDDRTIIEIEVNDQFLINYKEGDENPFTEHDRYDGKAILSHTMAHELMHFLFDLRSGEPIIECEVHCLEKMCFNPNHIIPPMDLPGTVDGKPTTIQKECKGEICQDEFCENMDNIKCEKKKKKPPPDEDEDDKNGSGKRSKIPGDEPDDNFSHSSGHYGLNSLMASLSAFPLNTDQDFFSYSYYPDILIYNKFDTGAMEHLLDRFMSGNYINDYIHDHFSNRHSLLVVPASELMGDQDSGIIKQSFENFVASGGKLLLLTQQYNSHMANILPFESEDTLKTFGFRQDQSCYLGSTYLEEGKKGQANL